MKHHILWLLCLASSLGAAEPAVRLTRLADRVRVEIGGRLFTEYIFKGASRPYCYPVLAADGTSLVRDFPERQAEGDETDHPHQRALMFAHGDLNQVDFWSEAGGLPFPKGRIEHAGLLESTDGATGTLRTHNRWIAPDGRLIATDETTLRFRGTATTRQLDYEVTLCALPDTPLVLGDTREGTMAIRVARWMTLPHKYQGRAVPGSGHLLNANGDRDPAVWGKRAAWCDYYAPRDGKIHGVALFDHPQNLRHPTWWMARDYGLFAANPFGQHEFEPDQQHPPGKGDHAIPAGGSLTLRYRILLHEDDPATARIAEHYAAYAAGR